MINLEPNKLRARTAAYDLLEELEIRRFPVSLFDICDYFGIKYDTFNSAPRSFQHSLDVIEAQGIEAMSYMRGNDVIILFDDTIQPSRCRFSLAHEIGHIMLKHHLTPPAVKGLYEYKDYKEVEADNFAGALIRPAVLIRKFGLTNTDIIMQAFDVSRGCAAVGLNISLNFGYDWYLKTHPFFNECDLNIPCVSNVS